MQNAAKPQSDQKLHLKFPSDNLSVRQALQQVLGLRLSLDEKSVVEIVLAEVLNNIVEHAYQERPTGRIDLTIERHTAGLDFLVKDEGLPLPKDLPHTQVMHDLNCAKDDLPEGGFGWLLVRELTENLHYEWREGQNILTFRIAADTVAQN
ncbi:serine/threonine-protein kinase RsbW [Aliiroseovarius halocynthiae]|uniref:ATP-binding protein n=1 Tax=Aliiroseovarius halocynthiae TaxID=985055 RepID=UPI00163D99BB|nr:ATP-binding protein [Aliiroseovarius halocynthiae]SMR82291.1 serine/threonine-protein kinase RsbW [Aliiroseovarius halocynthiae]